MHRQAATLLLLLLLHCCTLQPAPQHAVPTLVLLACCLTWLLQDRRAPAGVALRVRLLSVFCKSMAAANCFPQSLDVSSSRSGSSKGQQQSAAAGAGTVGGAAGAGAAAVAATAAGAGLASCQLSARLAPPCSYLWHTMPDTDIPCPAQILADCHCVPLWPADHSPPAPGRHGVCRVGVQACLATTVGPCWRFDLEHLPAAAGRL